MIDYEKLKMVHSLAEKYCNDNKPRKMRTSAQSFHGNWKFYLDIADGEKILFDCDYDNIDDMLAKLQELTQTEEPKAKYAVGQDVWFINIFHEPTYGTIERITQSIANEPDFIYSFVMHELPEEELYHTKQALIEAQIEYWRKIKDEL